MSSSIFDGSRRRGGGVEWCVEAPKGGLSRPIFALREQKQKKLGKVFARGLRFGSEHFGKSESKQQRPQPDMKTHDNVRHQSPIQKTVWALFKSQDREALQFAHLGQRQPLAVHGVDGLDEIVGFVDDHHRSRQPHSERGKRLTGEQGGVRHDDQLPLPRWKKRGVVGVFWPYAVEGEGGIL